MSISKRAEFNRTVRAFESKHGELKELLTSPIMAEEFWSHAIIIKHLARSIHFVDRHPDLADSATRDVKDDDTTDHYELKLYRTCPTAILFRNGSVNSSDFYKVGPRGTTQEMIDLQRIFIDLLKPIVAESKHIELGCFKPAIVNDIYDIAINAHNRFLLDKHYPCFLAELNWKDGHATALLTVSDPETGRVLVTLFINSWQSDSYFKNMKNCFLADQFHELMLKFEDKHWGKPSIRREDFNPAQLREYLKVNFSADIDDEEMLSKTKPIVNEKACAAMIVIDERDGSHYRDNPTFLQLAECSDIDKVFVLRRLSGKHILSLAHFPTNTPFIDVSHKLQIAEGDHNCSLYSFNFIKAIAELLNQPKMTSEVLALARNARHDPKAVEQLTFLFREKLKTFLPCYYQPDGQVKSPDELTTFHLHQRWEMGSKSIPILHPIREPEKTVCRA